MHRTLGKELLSQLTANLKKKTTTNIFNHGNT